MKKVLINVVLSVGATRLEQIQTILDEVKGSGEFSGKDFEDAYEDAILTWSSSVQEKFYEMVKPMVQGLKAEDDHIVA